MKLRNKFTYISGIVIFIVFGTFVSIFLFTTCRTIDATSKATTFVPVKTDKQADFDLSTSQILLIVLSDKTNNTGKIAKIFENVLGAQIKDVHSVNPLKLQNYTIIGFGSGIFDQKHHKSLLEFVDNMPQFDNKKVFIFSTSGISREIALKESKIIDDPHTPLRQKLTSKGCVIVDEFNCAGFNDNSFLKLFGGMNKGKPNAEDLNGAKQFAESLNVK